MKPTLIRQKGKGEQPLLPNRGAVNRLTKGEPWQKTIDNYAKVTPAGVSALDAPSVMQMAQVKY
jgi:hypothetical protein